MLSACFCDWLIPVIFLIKDCDASGSVIQMGVESETEHRVQGTIQHSLAVAFCCGLSVW